MKTGADQGRDRPSPVDFARAALELQREIIPGLQLLLRQWDEQLTRRAEARGGVSAEELAEARRWIADASRELATARRLGARYLRELSREPGIRARVH
jgi:hypothetical protein